MHSCVYITQIVKSSVHDARVSGINCFYLVFPQGPRWETVVVLLPFLIALIAHQGTTSQQPF